MKARATPSRGSHTSDMSDSRNPVRELISVEEAREDVLRTCRVGPLESVSLLAAVGRVLREDAVADSDIPPFDNSAMDGFAVSLADFDEERAELSIAEDLPAGSWPSKTVGGGACARIMTGAPVPDGCDAVAPIEWCESVGEVGQTVVITNRPVKGQHIRKSGSDIRKGECALPAPAAITPLTVGLLASLGYGMVEVSRRPTVSVVATGDELVDPSQRPERGQIRNSNGPTLGALVASAGATLVGLYTARDDYFDTKRVLIEALKADVVVVSGGVSVGTYDLVKAALDEMGFSRRFWRVRQRPGKPLTFGTIGETLVFGLPGNPVSSAVCFRQYVRPAIRAMLGLDAGPVHVKARLMEDIAKVPELHYFIPGRTVSDADGLLSVARSGAFGSHIFSSLAAADCIISIPEGPESVGSGSMVDVELFDDL